MRAAVLGAPIAHSLSPVLHRAAYAALGLHDWSYEAIECGEDELAPLLARSAEGWAGFSCTMPLKRVALALAGDVDPVAAAVGAANTLLRRDGGCWSAAMTDPDGIVMALAERRIAPGTVTVLGAGGTAQAAVAALVRMGVRRCVVLARDPARTGAVRLTAQRLGVAVEIAPLRADAAALSAELIISTLPSGVADPLAERTWQAGQSLLDVCYDPWPTPLASAFERAAGVVATGALMLLFQAATQVELMTGLPAPVAAMRSALRAAAPACGV
ncbi:MAG TPA: shikimate dehydrogenase [Jatrophihabitantaceae bacterium]|jgi:shikimate dehydrogenase|nr:shikimate dehydrogenase [Jatrophihabitantaceae bacterium]